MIPKIIIHREHKSHTIPGVVFMTIEQFEKDPVYSLPEYLFAQNQVKLGAGMILLTRNNLVNVLVLYKKSMLTEDYRRLGADWAKFVHKEKMEQVYIGASNLTFADSLAFIEGALLSGYRFLNYFKKEEKDKKAFSLKTIELYHQEIDEAKINKLLKLVETVFWSRDQVNEPSNVLTTAVFVERIKYLLKESNVEVDVLDKSKIQTLRMGGLLAVNQGSSQEPALVICHYKPSNPINKKPLVFVGKGITYDTGGLSLKPTASMDTMKSDMAGAASVVATISFIASQKIPVQIVGLVPVTDNRLQADSYAPGDVIQMHNGLFVEIMNTDAEGRLILADAISFAQKYDPFLTIEISTLTGSAQMAIGQNGSVFMGNASKAYFEQLTLSADKTNERLVQFPFWKEYAEMLKSEVADLKNVGGKEGGAITAGKFLEYFCSSPFIHIDIAGTAFILSDEGYRTKGATGVGVRLLSDFVENISIEADKS
jgi:leucyl aminopeptidase